MGKYPELPDRYSAESFRRWLSKLPEPCSTAGYTGVQQMCPAARWLSEEIGKPVKVDYSVIVVDGIIGYMTPEWLRIFERKIDGRELGGNRVPRRRALNVLTRATRPDAWDDW